MYLNSLKFLPAPVADGITEDALEELAEKALTERSEKRKESNRHVLNYQMMRDTRTSALSRVKVATRITPRTYL